MFPLYGRVFVLAARRAVRAWPIMLALIAYMVILHLAASLTAGWGIVGGFVMSLVFAACWSSQLDLISQAVMGSKLRVTWDEFRRTFGTHFWDVISVMFALWIIGFVTDPIVKHSSNPAALGAIIGIAMGFFLNVVPEMLYQGNTRSFALLIESGRFMLANPVVWLLPNLLFMAVALAPMGLLRVQHPAELLVLFGTFFNPQVLIAYLSAVPPIWAWPLILVGIHYVMIFRGILFHELNSGGLRRRNPFAAR